MLGQCLLGPPGTARPLDEFLVFNFETVHLCHGIGALLVGALLADKRHYERQHVRDNGHQILIAIRLAFETTPEVLTPDLRDVLTRL